MEAIGQLLSKKDKQDAMNMMDGSSNLITDVMEQWWSIYGIYIMLILWNISENSNRPTHTEGATD